MTSDPGKGRGAVFLDRDGTLIDELGFLSDPEGVRLYPGAAAAVARLNAAGWPVVLITNQSGIARGLLNEDDLRAIHARLAELLAGEGAHLDGVYHCPHHPSEGRAPFRAECECRKPKPGMLLRAAGELELDLERSWMVGDARRDLEAGRNAGLSGLCLVRTGKGESDDRADVQVVDDLVAAVEHILRG